MITQPLLILPCASEVSEQDDMPQPPRRGPWGSLFHGKFYDLVNRNANQFDLAANPHDRGDTSPQVKTGRAVYQLAWCHYGKELNLIYLSRLGLTRCGEQKGGHSAAVSWARPLRKLSRKPLLAGSLA